MTCVCGGPVWIKKSQECRSCYNKRYMKENGHRFTRDTCECGGQKNVRAKKCHDCYTASRKVTLTEEELEARRLARNAKVREYRRTLKANMTDEERIEYNRKKRGDTPEKRRARRAVRKARERGARVGRLVPNYLTLVFDFYGRKCLECGSTENLELDHVQPVARNGLHIISNMQVLCGPCNRRKNAHSSADYRHPYVLINLLGFKSGPVCLGGLPFEVPLN